MVIILKISLGVCALGSIHWSARYCALACDCLLGNRISPGLPTDQQQDLLWTNSSSDHLFIQSLTWRSCTHLLKLVAGTSVVASRNQQKSTVRENTITASPASSQGSELSPTLKKKISVSLISAKWHTKRKLTIGCYLPSPSDSHFPASLSPCGCQADCSLPISFGPRQPKKALPHRATTSSLFWY